MFVGLVQGGLGYVQYFNAVPELLVGTHIAFATVLWAITMWLLERLNLVGGSKHRPQISVPAPRPA
jgi:cytochrome c oxidase assembly protein subunit 15